MLDELFSVKSLLYKVSVYTVKFVSSRVGHVVTPSLLCNGLTQLPRAVHTPHHHPPLESVPY
jgi:hypothetical protein